MIRGVHLALLRHEERGVSSYRQATLLQFPDYISQGNLYECNQLSMLLC